MIQYMVTFAFIFFQNFLYKQNVINRKIFCNVVILWIIFMTGLRSQYMGIEDVWTNYVPMFNRICNQSFSEVIQYGYRDSGFAFVSKIVSVLTNNYQVWLFICGIPCIYGFGKLIEKKSSDPLCSFCLFFALGYFGYNTFLLRQSVALGFSILAYLAYEENKTKKAIALIVLASVFHATSIVVFMIIFFRWIVKRFNWKLLSLSFFCVLSVVGLALIKIILLKLNIARFDTYIQMMENGKQITNSNYYYLNSAIFFILFVLIIFVDRKVQQNENDASFEKSEFWILSVGEIVNDKALILGIATFTGLLSMMSSIGNIYRISLYFLAYEIVLLPKYIEMSFGKYRKLVLLLCEFLLIAYFLFSQINNQKINPFIFFWQ